jgi:hypothetical protein
MCQGPIAYGQRYETEENKNEIKTIADLTEQTFVLKNSTGSSNGTDCTNTFFGSDPLPGVPKQCFCDHRFEYFTLEDFKLS